MTERAATTTLNTSVVQMDDAPRVYVRPTLNRDLAAMMTLLFIAISYHIHHPTLLFRAQFGRAFRDEGLQEGIAVGLVISGLFLLFQIGSWERLWGERRQILGRLRLAGMVGLGLYTLHVVASIYFDADIFHKVYNLSPEYLEDTFREADLLDSAKMLNTIAVFGGLALASILYLWSPWEGFFQQLLTPKKLVDHIVALVTLLAGIIAYHIQHPLLNDRSWIGNAFEGSALQSLVALILAAGIVYLSLPYLKVNGNGADPEKSLALHIRWFLIGLAGLFALHVLAVVFADYNVFTEYYKVSQTTLDELLGNTALNPALLDLDRAAIFAGIAGIAVLILWSPWERLDLYVYSVRNNIAPLLVAIIAVIAWEQIINIFDIKQFLLPRPSVIWDQLKEDYPKLVAAGWFTFLNAFKGFLIGSALGMITGTVSARFTKFSTGLLPLAIAANSIPIIAFAPISNFWFGVTSPNSKIAIVAVMCYFPTMISTVRGLTSVDTIQLELMKSYAASEIEIFRWLRFPNALPFIFSSLKLATTLSMIGAIVSEFFGGSLSGLGYRIREDAALFRFPESWSAIIVASVFGISFYLLISALERTSMPWYQSFRSES